MVQFIKKDPNEIKNVLAGSRGRVSYPILKGFMETGLYLAEADVSDTGRTPSSMAGLLKMYIDRHNIPVKPFVRDGALLLMRLDIDEEGNAIDDWDAAEDAPEDDDAPPITVEEIKKRG